MQKFLSVLLLILMLSPGFLRAQSAQELMDLDTLQATGLIKTPNLPQDSVSTADDITALYINPAGLGVHPLQVGYFYGHNSDDNLQDHTAFLNLLGLAFSGQWRFAPQSLKAQRYTLGTSLGNTRYFSVGTSYSFFDSNVASLDDFSQWDLGFLLRPFRILSFGLVGRALNKPRLGQEEFQPRWDISMALRPPISRAELLTLAVDTTWNQKDQPQNLLPRYSVEIVPAPGFTLYGGWDNLNSKFFGLKFSQNISQLSFQMNSPATKGNFYSGGILFGTERFKSKGEVIRSYLVLDLEIPFEEQKKEGTLFFAENTTFYEIIKAISVAKEDSQIQGILLKGRYFTGGWGQAEELRRELQQFQSGSGKKVVAFLESAGNKEYYISSCADMIVMPQAGTLEISGLKSELIFIKGLLDKVGVEADFIHIGDYKTAPEIFTRESPSKFAEEQTRGILKSLHEEYLRAILKSRPALNREQLTTLMNEGYFTAEQARKSGLIDKVMYFTDLKEELLQDKISDIFWKKDFHDYIKTAFYDDSWGPKPVIAILILEGDIISGTSGGGGFFSGTSIGSDTVAETLRNLREDRAVEGVVLRINSPGGSGLASDVIWNEIRLLMREKPVTVSISNVAASGGYYLAVGADNIFASQNSITGSIGVFAGKFSLSGLYKWLGVNKTVYKTNPKATLFSETDKFTDEERELLKQHLNEFYALFLDRVKRNRTALSAEQVEKNAGGRVYTGGDAFNMGMVDQLGGLRAAIEFTIQKARLDAANTDVLVYSNTASGILNLGDASRMALPAVVRESIRLMSRTDNLRNDRVFFMMPYDVEIR